MGDPISILYTSKMEEKELLERHNSIKFKKQKNDSIILHNFIQKRVHPKFQKKLIRLIENYSDDIILSLTNKNEEIYRDGFNACLDLIFNSRTN